MDAEQAREEGHQEDQEEETETTGQEEATAPTPQMAAAHTPPMTEDREGADDPHLEDPRQTTNHPTDPSMTQTMRSKGTAVEWKETNAG